MFFFFINKQKGELCMKDIKNIVENLDKKVDKVSKKKKRLFRRYFPIFSGITLVLLTIFFVYRTYKTQPAFETSVITEDISIIVTALNRIDETCNILSIKNNKNSVDFLNVVKFVGSEVGCLNLAYPENWEGPYVLDNPTIRGKVYEIVKTKQGYFVIPGYGVELPNDLTVGKDFDIDLEADIEEMLQSGGPLNYKDFVLGAKLEFEIGDWGKKVSVNEKIETINSVLEEFNEAMPFTQNEKVQASA
jgi:hypothetical protein